MVDALRQFSEVARRKTDPLRRFGLRPKKYCLATVHRPSNTDRRENLEAILSAFAESGETVVFPVHPRTRKFLERFGLWRRFSAAPNLVLTEPLSYLDILLLEEAAKKILTDSGGMQKEAYLWKVPCITLREETEWTETVESGWNILVGADKTRILQALRDFHPAGEQKFSYGDGRAAEKIVSVLEEKLDGKKRPFRNGRQPKHRDEPGGTV